MLKKYICIVCPNSCEIAADVENGQILSLTGANCTRGQDYVRQELTNPVRNIASSVLLEDGVLPLASIRLSRPIPKEKIFLVMKIIKQVRLEAPVKIGQVVIANVLGLGSDVIVTKNIDAK